MRFIELEHDLDRVREIVTRPENFYYITGLDHIEDYEPDPNNLYFKVNDGLVIYEPKPALCLEMHTAVNEMPDKPIAALHDQWAYLAELGFYKVYCFAQHHRARFMCRAAGMNLFNDNCFEKVIHG